jgi:gamma-glutamyltranspeptidase/glutathione hydrolase
MLEYRKLASLPPRDGMPDAQAIHLIAEAGRLAFADRGKYVADTDFVPLPGGSIDALVDKRYLAARGELIGERSMGRAAAGEPLGIKLARGMDRAPELQSTSHLSIVDAQGHAVAMTTSVENAFGSRLMVRGFMLNNQLTDFSFVGGDADGLVANRLQPGKRPRSAMAPTMVFDRANHRLILAIGSPGGPAIINYVAKVLFGVLDWQLGLQEAIDLPNFGSRNGPTELEQGRIAPAIVQQLQARGHAIRLGSQTSGLQGIARRPVDGPAGWIGAADPRREGSAEGD